MTFILAAARLARGRGSRGGPRLPQSDKTFPSVAHRALDVADLEQPDLAEVDVSEGVRDEGIEPRLVDPHVEDRAASGRDADGLHAPLVLRHVAVDPRAVEDGADDVESGL